MQQNTPGHPFSPQIEEDLGAAQELMYRDQPLSPKMIATLMHVGVSLHSTYSHEDIKRKSSLSSFVYFVTVVVISIILALSIGTLFAYTNEIGPFYAGGEPHNF